MSLHGYVVKNRSRVLYAHDTQTFDRQANESGLYDVDSSWPTEYWVVKKEIAYDKMQADRKTANIRSFYSVTNNQRKAQQRTASQYTTGLNNSTRNRWLFKTAASSTSFDSFTDVNCQRAFVAKPPMTGSIKADNLAIFVGDPNHH
ncbi:hypothetical protein T06_5912 [Trichinella sp. T6]|nr:hypothetical protein T06_5912 [Trichinella sp. T6]